MSDSPVDSTRLLCTLRLGDLLFGIPVEQVQEVLRAQCMAGVPLARREIAGLLALRGRIVTAVDLRRCLQLSDRPDGQASMNVIVRVGDDVVSLVVDSVGDVLPVEKAGLEPAPDTVPAEVRDRLLGVYKLPEQLLLVLDAERACGWKAEKEA